MGRLWRKAPFLVPFIFAMVAYSLAVAWAAWKLGIDHGTGTVAYASDTSAIQQLPVQGYFQKLNWLLFPLYWPILGMLVHFSWKFYIDAWRSMPQNQLLYSAGVAVKDESMLEPFLHDLIKFRRYLIGLSVIVGLTLTTIDGWCLLHEYGILFQRTCGAPDFTVAFRLLDNFPNFQGRNKVALFDFIVAQYLMQGFLTAMGLAVLFQLLLRSFAFLNFEQLSLPTQQQLSIRLNARDDFCEFGLMDMNEAIKLTYIFIAVGMVIPVLFVANKPPGADIGHTLMSLLLPLLIFAPAAIPLCNRILRRDKATRKVCAANDPKLIKAFSKQKLSPFDQTAFSYVGKVCLVTAIGLWVYVVTGEVKSLWKVVGG